MLSLISLNCGGAIEDYESNYVVEKQYDKFEQTTRYIMRENILDGGYAGYGVVYASSLNIRKDVTPIETKYWLILICINNDWLFVNEKSPMSLLIDGEKFDIFHDGDVNREVVNPEVLGKSQGVYCKETGYFPTDKDFIIKMANAKSIDIKIVGKSGYVERKFNKSNFKNFKRFTKEYMK